MTEQQISRTQAWLESLRPKTLSLAFATVTVGTVLAWWQGHFDPLVALLALITVGLLQILSNPVNDYDDAVKGSDKPDRIGPPRGMQEGVITQQEMKRALTVTVMLICLPGLVLVAVACHTLADFAGFLILGGLSIVVAIIYTMGNHPYDYIGLGDISVLVSSGQLSVMGSWYLQAHTLIPALALSATACGLLATAVLNTDNLRDTNSGRENDKNMLMVHLGAVNVYHYHAYLLMGSLVCLVLFNLFSLHSPWGWLFLLAALLLVKQTRYMMREMDPVAMRSMLERTVKGVLLANLLLVLGIFLSQWAA